MSAVPESPTVFLVAGEASGDLRGAELVAAIRERSPDARFVGMGGDRLSAAGMEILVDTHEVSTMGLTEVVSKLGRILASYRRLRGAITAGRPDLVVLIDFPDFNLRLAGAARRAGVPVLYYVSPQVWAWRRYRVRTLARRVDHLAVVFPFEEEIYRGLTDVTFVGHPALETVRATSSRDEVLARHGLSADAPVIALLPGSRAAEIEELLPAMVAATERLDPSVQPIVALAHEGLRDRVSAHCRADLPVVAGETWDLVAAADLTLSSSGSATLETALLGTPMVIMYRLSALTYAVARRLVRVPFIGMPNLVLGEGVVPELIQDDVTPARIAAEARRILEDPGVADRMRADLARVRSELGTPGAAGRTADIALRMIGGSTFAAAGGKR